MERLDRLIEGIRRVDDLINDDILEPDLDRRDWLELKARINLIHDTLYKDVVDVQDDVLVMVQHAEFAHLMRRRIAGLLSQAAVLLYAVGDIEAFRRLLTKACAIASDAAHRLELEMAVEEPRGYCRFQHARWLQAHLRFKDADKLLASVSRETRHPALQEAAKQALNAPRPLKSIPPLFRLIGCGTGLYGHRDPSANRSYIATYCICLLWIPIVPLAAYRVQHVNHKAYRFFAKEALSPWMRLWRMVVLVAASICIAWYGIITYLDSPRYESHVEVEKGQSNIQVKLYPRLSDWPVDVDHSSHSDAATPVN